MVDGCSCIHITPVSSSGETRTVESCLRIGKFTQRILGQRRRRKIKVLLLGIFLAKEHLITQLK